MVFQIRPIDARFADRHYAPERDLANVGPVLVLQAVKYLDEEIQEPWFREFWQRSGADSEQLGLAVASLANMLNSIMEIKNPVEAARQSGLLAKPSEVQAVLMASLGRAVLLQMWVSIRDQRLSTDTAPTEFSVLLQEVDGLQCQLRGSQPRTWSRFLWDGLRSLLKFSRTPTTM